MFILKSHLLAVPALPLLLAAIAKIKASKCSDTPFVIHVLAFTFMTDVCMRIQSF